MEKRPYVHLHTLFKSQTETWQKKWTEEWMRQKKSEQASDGDTHMVTGRLLTHS